MPAKSPTPQGISRLLAKAEQTRAVVKIHGGRSGFVARAGAPGEVFVNYYFMFGTGRSTERDQEMCARYAELIADAGYRATYDERMQWLVVTAQEG